MTGVPLLHHSKATPSTEQQTDQWRLHLFNLLARSGIRTFLSSQRSTAVLIDICIAVARFPGRFWGPLVKGSSPVCSIIPCRVADFFPIQLATLRQYCMYIAYDSVCSSFSVLPLIPIGYFYLSPQSEGARHRCGIDYLTYVRLSIQKRLSLPYEMIPSIECLTHFQDGECTYQD